MSIVDEIASRVHEGRLKLIDVPTHRRAILVTEDVWRFLQGPWDDAEQAVAANELRAVLHFISSGGAIVIGSGKHRTCHLKELTMAAPRVWEICSRAPKPGFRLFGMFADTDIFIGTNFADRLSLGTQRSPEFKAAIRTCKARWRSLFATYEPKTGDLHDYIKENVTDARELH